MGLDWSVESSSVIQWRDIVSHAVDSLARCAAWSDVRLEFHMQQLAKVTDLSDYFHSETATIGDESVRCYVEVGRYVSEEGCTYLVSARRNAVSILAAIVIASSIAAISQTEVCDDSRITGKDRLTPSEVIAVLSECPIEDTEAAARWMNSTLGVSE